jgi:predicted Rossmann fold flavoprotein
VQELSQTLDLIVIGGGAAGYFGAINYAKRNPEASILILEASNKVLQKVRVSGGGRCNVTHFLFDPKEMVEFYPRGKKELLGPLNHFQPGDTMAWFGEYGVNLIPEEDNRMFPESNTSETIIQLFEQLVRDLGIKLKIQTRVTALRPCDSGWELEIQEGGNMKAKQVMLAAGGTTSFYPILQKIGIQMIPPAPSLFSFHFEDKSWLDGLAGNSLINLGVSVNLPQFKMEEEGPVVITHKGMSGPGILKLSAWGADVFRDMHYRFPIQLNFLSGLDLDSFEAYWSSFNSESLVSKGHFDIPKRTWGALIDKLGFTNFKSSEIKGSRAKLMFESLSQFDVKVIGKSTHKEEFVTAGGIDLKEINFKTMELKRFPGLYAAGELLNIDGLTGGFNFQAAWTGAFIAAENFR